MSAVPDEHTGMLDTTPDPTGDAVPASLAAELKSETEELIAEADAPAARTVRSQTYFRLVWRRFRRNTMGMIGAALVALLLLATVFANFLSPYSPVARNKDAIYSPPQSLHFFSDEGFHPIPFTNPVVTEIDPQTFAAVTKVDTETRCRPEFLVAGPIACSAFSSTAICSPRRPTARGTFSAPTATAATCCRVCWLAAS